MVETHGRKETEALLDGLEVVPRRPIEYKGRWLDEMDLDAIIARRPQFVLVDELAHTNVPGSRHPKRYLDVEELLSCGIDVYTTVNIQHIESLNDVVAQITGVRVRETVPDSILDRADAIELVDLTPDDLIQRLKEGKVYVPKQAERALEHFFSPANLTALRELALRRTAERVDEQLLTEMQARAISGPWAAGERILVCVSEDPRAAGLVRYAKRLADRLHASWTALYVETRRSLQLTEEERDRIADTLRLAAGLGRRGGHHSRRRPPHRRRRGRLCAGEQHHATSSSANPRGRAGSSSCTARSCMIWCAAAAISAFTSSPARTSTRADAEERRCAPPTGRRRFDARPYVRRPARRGRGARRRPAAPAVVRNREHRPCVPHRRRRRRRALRPLAVAARQRRGVALLQFLLPAARSTPSPSPIRPMSPHSASSLSWRSWSPMSRRGCARRPSCAMARARTTESLYAFSRKLAGVGTLDDVLWATAYQIASCSRSGWCCCCRKTARLR